MLCGTVGSSTVLPPVLGRLSDSTISSLSVLSCLHTAGAARQTSIGPWGSWGKCALLGRQFIGSPWLFMLPQLLWHLLGNCHTPAMVVVGDCCLAEGQPRHSTLEELLLKILLGGGVRYGAVLQRDKRAVCLWILSVVFGLQCVQSSFPTALASVRFFC